MMTSVKNVTPQLSSRGDSLIGYLVGSQPMAAGEEGGADLSGAGGGLGVWTARAK
jgi:hypothetical protein